MSNSPLVVYTKISPNKNSPRMHPITKLTLHHQAGNLSPETCGAVFAPYSAQASSNYSVASDGRVGMYVEEKDRAWTSSNADNDHRAVTIEVANDGGAPDWHVSDTAIEATIALCVDICKRNGIKSINYTGDKSGNLTRHNMFASTQCPGPYLQSKFPYIANEINKRLNGNAPVIPCVKPPETKPNPTFTPYVVKVTSVPCNIRTGPGNNYPLVTQIKEVSSYTITDIQPGPGSAQGWGKLKSGLGFIPLILTKKV